MCAPSTRCPAGQLVLGPCVPLEHLLLGRHVPFRTTYSTLAILSSVAVLPQQTCLTSSPPSSNHISAAITIVCWNSYSYIHLWCSTGWVSTESSILVKEIIFRSISPPVTTRWGKSHPNRGHPVLGLCIQGDIWSWGTTILPTTTVTCTLHQFLQCHTCDEPPLRVQVWIWKEHKNCITNPPSILDRSYVCTASCVVHSCSGTLSLIRHLSCLRILATDFLL